ncbi:MAG: phosphoribosylamine--glycine ligase [Fimbriimonadales bacterium]|nr:phosphoribosylamine--glycine ligase [Fimbriimonadales bacterium]
MNKVLIIGSGGREHALAWKLARECEVHALPGNPGIEEIGQCHPGDVADLAEVARLARNIAADLVLVGPENPLLEGLADVLRSEGLVCFGPGKREALLEGSKAFAKELMVEAGVPTAWGRVCRSFSEGEEAVQTLHQMGKRPVVKASGAALGKGVTVCNDLREALLALERTMVELEFGEAGRTVVVEERLEGREFSLLTVCSGEAYWSLPVAQDYKRAEDGDRGPNTGGMGSVSPTPWVTEDLVREAEEKIVAPILRALSQRGLDYRGVLFSGLMVQDGEVFCLEYNVRFGDPETQSVVARLGDGFYELLLETGRGGRPQPIGERPEAAVTVVLTSGGYPGAYAKGLPIVVPSEVPSDTILFHAGTARRDGDLVTAGGRVFGATGLGPTVQEARRRAYKLADLVQFDGKRFRSDIGAYED